MIITVDGALVEVPTEKILTVTFPMAVSVERISDLLCNAIEGGSGYWADFMDRHGATLEQAPYRQDVPFVEGGWLEVGELEGECRSCRVDLDAIKKGLRAMAERYPEHFANFLNQTDDAETGDVFLQCCCFGEVIYG